jgi:hypothetical protein
MKGGAPPALMPRDRAAVLSGLAAVVCIGRGPGNAHPYRNT